MAKSEAELRAQRKYVRTPKGKKALDEAHKKRVSTEEYRAYQREKQREYRRRRKLEASAGVQAQQTENPSAREGALVPSPRGTHD